MYNYFQHHAKSYRCKKRGISPPLIIDSVQSQFITTQRAEWPSSSRRCSSCSFASEQTAPSTEWYQSCWSRPDHRRWSHSTAWNQTST